MKIPNLPLTHFSALYLIMGFFSQLHGDILVYEGFQTLTAGGSDYLDGSILHDQNPDSSASSIGWDTTDPWATSSVGSSTNVNAFTNETYSLSVGALETTTGAAGFRRFASAGSGAISFTRDVDSSLAKLFAAGETFYFSYLVNQEDWSLNNTRVTFDNGNGTFSVGFDTSGKLGAWRQTSALGTFVGMDGTGAGASFSTDTTYFVSGRLVLAPSGNNDSIELFAPIAVGGIPQAEPLAFYSASSLDIQNNARDFDFISMTGYRPGIGDNGVTYDEVRLGELYSDISPIPEPSTMVLMGIAIGAILIMRRRC